MSSSGSRENDSACPVIKNSSECLENNLKFDLVHQAINKQSYNPQVEDYNHCKCRVIVFSAEFLKADEKFDLVHQVRDDQ